MNFLGVTMKAFSTLKVLSVIIASSIFTASVCSAEEEASTTTVFPPSARYVIVSHPTFRGDKYLLDTQTGKTWQLVQAGKGGELYWQQMRFTNYISRHNETQFWNIVPE